MKKINVLTIYALNKATQELEYRFELSNAEQVAKYFGLKNARQYITSPEEADKGNYKRMIRDQFVVIKEEIDFDNDDMVIYSI